MIEKKREGSYDKREKCIYSESDKWKQVRIDILRL